MTYFFTSPLERRGLESRVFSYSEMIVIEALRECFQFPSSEMRDKFEKLRFKKKNPNEA